MTKRKANRMGRPSIGDRPMTDAERMRRHRASKAEKLSNAAHKAWATRRAPTEFDYLFQMRPDGGRDYVMERRALKELPATPFYLLFQYLGGDEDIGSVTTKADAVKRARKHAAEHPTRQFVVMKAEVIVRAKLTAPEIEEIEL
jgi:hypothetical protein